MHTWLSKGLTLRLFQLMHHCYSMWTLSCTVNHLRTAVGELVGFHHSHLGPVREIDTVLKQTDAKWVWDHSTSMDHCFSIKGNNDEIDLFQYQCINLSNYFFVLWDPI